MSIVILKASVFVRYFLASSRLRATSRTVRRSTPKSVIRPKKPTSRKMSDH